jgi:hypothetical protein
LHATAALFLVIALSLFLFTGGADIALSLLLVILLPALSTFDLVELVISPRVSLVIAHLFSLPFILSISLSIFMPYTIRTALTLS